MKVNLNGKVAHVTIRYCDSTREAWRKSKRVEIPVRVTKIMVTVLNEDGTTAFDLDGSADCVPEDNYNKITGKRLALRDLFDKDPDRQFLSTEDRKVIVQSTCPSLCNSLNES